MSSGIPYWPCDKCEINLVNEKIKYYCVDKSHMQTISLCEKHAKEQNEVCNLCGKPLIKKIFNLHRNYY
jgi:hypothetical protein